MEIATATYELFVAEAVDYLAARGLGLALADTCRLGVVREPMVGHEAFEGRLSIPYITKAGIVNIKFRCMGDHECKEQGHGKYLGLSHPSRIYNTLAFFEDTPVLAITEGEFDAMVLSYQVGIPAVSIPGAQAWKKFYRRCFTDYEKILVFADGDDPGRDFAKQISSLVDGITIVQMPQDTDVNSVYVAEGADGLRKRAGL